MPKACFCLVASVIATQLIIVSGTIVGCFITVDNQNTGSRCTGEGIQELMTFITAQSFALYAAEKR